MYDTVAKKWTYKEVPTETQISSSSERLSAIEANAAVAFDKALSAESSAASAQNAAESAQNMADTAQNAAADANNKAELAQALAESKVSLEEVQESLFPATGLDGKKHIMTEIRFFVDDDGWKISFCSYPAGRPNQGSCSELGYAGLSDFYALYDRVSAIEQRLGIS